VLQENVVRRDVNTGADDRDSRRRRGLPATVTKGSEITSGFALRSMTPATSKTMMRGPLVSSAARKEPGPSAPSVVTRRI
jgi:hypothetical protein